MSVTFRDTGDFESADIKYPLVDGSANQVLVTDGAGNLSFATVPIFPTGQVVLGAGGSGDSGVIPIGVGRKGVIRAVVIGTLTSGANSGEAITYVLNASYSNTGGVGARIGVSDDIIVNKDTNVNRNPGVNMDSFTAASGSGLTISFIGDATDSSVFDYRYDFFESP